MGNNCSKPKRSKPCIDINLNDSEIKIDCCNKNSSFCCNPNKKNDVDNDDYKKDNVVTSLV